VTLSGDRLRVYIDADVLLAGLATENPSAASRVVLEASELTLLDLLASRKVMDECERNLSEIAPERSRLESLRQSLRDAVGRAVEVVDNPPSLSSIPETDPKDVIHLTSAASHNCDFLVTYNLSDYPRTHKGTAVVEPGTLVRRIREQIRNLD
jgi:predicted nucleic acid-binding protein